MAFWAHWCRPCRTMAPVVDRLCAERPDVLVAKVDVNRDARLAQSLAVRAVPTMMRFDCGTPTAIAVGVVAYDRLLALLRLDPRRVDHAAPVHGEEQHEMS